MDNQEVWVERRDPVISLGDWIITLILISIPIVNLIMLLIWAFGSSTPVSKSNFAKAALIMWLIGMILVFLFWGSFVSMMGGYPAGTSI